MNGPKEPENDMPELIGGMKRLFAKVDRTPLSQTFVEFSPVPEEDVPDPVELMS